MEDNIVEWMDRIPEMGFLLQIQISPRSIVIGSAPLLPPHPPLPAGCLNKSFKQTPASCLTRNSTYRDGWVPDFA